MIPPNARIALATQPVDFRKGPDGLTALVRDAGANPFCEYLTSPGRPRRSSNKKLADEFGECLRAPPLAVAQRLRHGSLRLS
jgi:transposase